MIARRGSRETSKPRRGLARAWERRPAESCFRRPLARGKQGAMHLRSSPLVLRDPRSTRTPVDCGAHHSHIVAGMRHEIVLAPEAVDDLRRLSARDRSTVKGAIETHLRHQSKRTCRTRIKRLLGVSRPQHRLRVGDIRVFYDVRDVDVEVLANVAKADATEWLSQFGDRRR